MRKLLLVGVATLGLGITSVAPALANPIVLNFMGLDALAREEPLNFYAGGFGSLGSGPGPDYGITFPSNVITCTGLPNCNTNEVPGTNLIFFLSGTADTMDVPGGFTTGFSFYYSAVSSPASITVWSGVDGTGTLLATLALPLTPDDGDPGCGGASFCPYEPIGVTFSGTAESVNFGGTENEVGFADVTLGSATAGGGGNPVPEPASLTLLGLGLAGGYLRRRKNAA